MLSYCCFDDKAKLQEKVVWTLCSVWAMFAGQIRKGTYLDPLSHLIIQYCSSKHLCMSKDGPISHRSGEIKTTYILWERSMFWIPPDRIEAKVSS